MLVMKAVMPLHVAATRDNSEIVNILLKNGANSNAASNGRTYISLYVKVIPK